MVVPIQRQYTTWRQEFIQKTDAQVSASFLNLLDSWRIVGNNPGRRRKARSTDVWITSCVFLLAFLFIILFALVATVVFSGLNHPEYFPQHPLPTDEVGVASSAVFIKPVQVVKIVEFNVSSDYRISREDAELIGKVLNPKVE